MNVLWKQIIFFFFLKSKNNPDVFPNCYLKRKKNTNQTKKNNCSLKESLPFEQLLCP